MSMFRRIFTPGDDKSCDEREDIRNIEYKRKIDPLFRDPVGKGHVHILMEHGYDNPEDLDYILSSGCEINISDNDGNYPIHIAARRGLKKCVKKLIQRNSLLDVFNKQQLTPLMIAAKSGQADIMFNILQNGANPNIANAFNKNALHFACTGGSLSCLKLLLESRIRVNLKDSEGYTALIHASKNGHLEQVQCLLEYRGSAETHINEVDINKRTALHWAVEGGHASIVSLLLEHAIQTNVADVFNDTPFARALKCNRPEILKKLLENNSDRGRLAEFPGTSLGLSALFGLDDCLQVLLNFGDPVDDLSYFGLTPLMAAVHESRLKTVQILLEAGANANVLGKNGISILSMAMMNLNTRNEEQRHEIIKTLVRHGVNVNAKISPTNNHLFYVSKLNTGLRGSVTVAIATGYVSLTKILLLASASVTANDIDLLSQNAFLGQSVISDVMLDLLKEHAYQPRTLKQQSRVLIRRVLRGNIVKSIDRLPVARPLQRFLNFDDLEEISPQFVPQEHGVLIFANFGEFTPCSIRPLRGSLLFDSLTTVLGVCQCDVCKRVI